MRIPLLALLAFVGLLVLSGCIVGGDKLSVAKEFATLRDPIVTTGLLAPSTSEGRQQYRSALVAMRPKVNGLSDGKTIMQAYLDGSVAAVDMQESMNQAFALLKQVNQDALDCATGSPADQAIQLLQSAQENASTAHDSFVAVEADVPLTNALGADYVTTAAQATENIPSSLSDTVQQLQQNCI